ncbi:hypothetical protein RCH23_002934 [Cryobacterium sp. CAN_C3]|nr:hypothetical protein [Cryobacterium sp. CAN_C3]
MVDLPTMSRTGPGLAQSCCVPVRRLVCIGVDTLQWVATLFALCAAGFTLSLVAAGAVELFLNLLNRPHGENPTFDEWRLLCLPPHSPVVRRVTNALLSDIWRDQTAILT